MEREQLRMKELEKGSGFQKETKLTPEYLKRKMESMMNAMYDSIEESEKRMRLMEKQLFELKRDKAK